MSQKLCSCQQEAKKETVVIKIKTCYGKHSADKPEDFVTVSFKNCNETSEDASKDSKKPEPSLILCTNRPKPNEKLLNDQNTLPESTIILYKREPEPKDKKPLDNQDKLLLSPAPRKPEEIVPPEESSTIQNDPPAVVDEPEEVESAQIPEDPSPSEQPQTPIKLEDTPKEPEDIPKEPEDTPKEPEDPPKEPEDTPEEPEDIPEEPEDTLKEPEEEKKPAKLKSVGTKPPTNAANDEIIKKPLGHAILPTISPRYHGNGCTLEICLLERHEENCPNHKEGNPQRNPLDDKTGSYEAIGRMTFRTCNAMNENANKDLIQSKMVLYYSLINSCPSSSSTQSETRLQDFFDKIADSKKNFDLKRSFSAGCVCNNNCKHCEIQCDCKEIDLLSEKNFGNNKTVQVETKAKRGWFQIILSCIAK